MHRHRLPRRNVGGGALPSASASHRTPASGRARNSASGTGSSTPQAHGLPLCFTASSACRRIRSSWLGANAAGHPGGPLGKRAGTSPVAPSSTAFSTIQANRSRSPAPTASTSSRRRGAPLGALDLDLPAVAARDQPAMADEPGAVPQLERLALAARGEPAGDAPRPRQQPAAPPDRHRARLHERDHPRRAATAHHPASIVSSIFRRPASREQRPEEVGFRLLHAREDGDAAGPERRA